ncbi:MAG TPA: glycosyltransferase [Terracidiphilus sp.]|nr:glycosyltransferase [Terracidiphilus sp.]
MRIAYILNTLEIGGAERLVVSLAERMAARGHVVVIMALREAGAGWIVPKVDVRSFRMEKSPASVGRGWVRAAQMLRGFRPDVIHSHNFYGNLLARSLRVCVQRARIVSTIHNVYEGGTARMLALRLTDPLSDCSVAVCHAAADAAVSSGVVPVRKCSVIANGVDAVAFSPDASRRAETRRSMDVSGEFVWLAAGRVVPAKDYPNVLRAFAAVHGNDARARLWIAGDGSPAYVAEMRGLGEQLGVSSAVRWLGARSDVPALMDAADGFVLASAWEGMPMALAEAMAMEKAVVATDVGGVRELAGDCARLVPARHSEMLAGAMLDTMRSPAEAREALGRAARSRMVEQFDFESKAGEWERVYMRVANSRA